MNEDFISSQVEDSREAMNNEYNKNGWKFEDGRKVLVWDEPTTPGIVRRIFASSVDGECLFYGNGSYKIWSRGWREISSKPQIKPFKTLPHSWAGKAVRGKTWENKEEFTTVTGSEEGFVTLPFGTRNRSISLETFARNWETMDGEPCGEVVE